MTLMNQSSTNQRNPKVAIIGRPNVGKSTLFNILTGSRKAVVKNEPGVTRDIQLEAAEVWGRSYDLIDTGGITESVENFSQLIRESVTEFLDQVDLLIVVMDGRAGLVPEDRDIVKISKSVGKPMLIVINKIDKVSDSDLIKSEFYEFGQDLVDTCFETRRGVAQILEFIHTNIPEQNNLVVRGPRIAVVGKPNAGKSSLVNQILGENRMLVSEVAGTTVDAVDTPFVFDGKTYVLVDTAGLRRSSKREEDVEIIAAFKAHESIRRSDLVLLVVDALIGPTEQDAKILQAILESHKAVIMVANKSDLGKEQVENFRTKIRHQIDTEFHFFTDIPMIFTSAKTGAGIRSLLDEMQRISGLLDFRVSTSELNDFFFETIRKAPAPVAGTKNVKFYYLTQTYQKPPSFIAFANHPEGVTPSYRRFIVKHMKDRFHLQGVPIRVFIMKTRSGGPRNTGTPSDS